MWHQHPPHTQLSAESEKASRTCSGEKPGVSRLGSGSVPRLGGHKTPALSYLSGKRRYTKTLKESTVYETPYRVVWKPRQGFYMSFI